MRPKVEVKWHLPEDAEVMADDIAEYFECAQLRSPLQGFLTNAPLSDAIKGAAIVRTNGKGPHHLSIYLLTESELVSPDNSPTEVLRDDYREMLDKTRDMLDVEVSFANLRGEDLQRIAYQVGRDCQADKVEIAVTDQKTE